MFTKVYKGNIEIKSIYIGSNKIKYGNTTPPIDPDALAPDKVLTFEAIDITPTELTLIWTFTGDESNLEGFVITKDGVLIKTLDKTTRSVLIDGLKPNSIISFRIISSGRNGKDSKPFSLSARTPATYEYVKPLI